MRLIHAPLVALLLMASAAIAAEADTENYYTKSYVNKNNPTVALQPDPDGPKLYSGNVKEEDYQRMLRSGYELRGYSSFEAADVAPEQATEHARKIGADLVLVYSKLTGSVPISVKIQQLREKAAKSDAEKTAAGESAVEVQKPAQENRYAYFASYWVKLAPPVIGVHVKGPGINDVTQGLVVVAVIKDSPAARADIQEGDMLVRIGEIDLNKPEALSLAAQRYAGQTVDVTLQRDGSDSKTSMTMNPRK